MDRRALVLDANILIRAVLGPRVRRILEAHADSITFFVPETGEGPNPAIRRRPVAAVTWAAYTWQKGLHVTLER
ncbi:MAG: hypothetical protein HYX27_23600 [Acidobacteria bacterium]|nr:hypothetical protein [Acidobacteriota bacterium]